MQNQISTIPPSADHRPDTQKRSWIQAYVRFLISPQESLILKIAPLAFLVGAPELIVSEFLPIIGEISDFGVIVIAAIVAVRTVHAVSRYRQ